MACIVNEKQCNVFLIKFENLLNHQRVFFFGSISVQILALSD